MKWPFFIRYFIANRELNAIKKSVERHSLTAQERENVRRFASGQNKVRPLVWTLYKKRFTELENTLEMQFLSESFNDARDYAYLNKLRKQILEK